MAALTVEELLSNGASLTEHNDIFHLSDGQFYCRLCWKFPSDMNRVIEHLGGHEHIRRMSIKAYHENPLDWVPVEQQPWTVIINCAAHCKLCNKAMVETHWNCAVHLRRVQREMSQQQQSPWASSSSQSHIFSATTQSSSPLPHVKSCQHEMTSRGLVESPPPLPQFHHHQDREVVAVVLLLILQCRNRYHVTLGNHQRLWQRCVGNSTRTVLVIKKSQGRQQQIGSNSEVVAVVLQLELLILALLLVVQPQARLPAKRRLLSMRRDGKYMRCELVSTMLSSLAVLSCIILFFTYALEPLLKTTSKNHYSDH